MHLKDSPIISVKEEYAGFQLDASKIELHNSDKRNILLPYSGELPDKLRDNDGAYISMPRSLSTFSAYRRLSETVRNALFSRAVHRLPAYPSIREGKDTTP